IYHIYIDGLKLKNRRVEGDLQNFLPHVPVDEKTLNASVTDLLETKMDLPDISEGYEAWREAEGGVFNIPMKKIIQVIEEASST
ncbi:MAG: hypothetical protein AAFW75_16735, partial [Cyanobacteria bacterium J06636_16]